MRFKHRVMTSDPTKDMLTLNREAFKSRSFIEVNGSYMYRICEWLCLDMINAQAVVYP